MTGAAAARAPFLVLLFILPYPGTVALRLICLLAAFAVAAAAWRRSDAPPLPCKLPFLLWAGVALASLSYAVDFGYSLREIKNEVGYSLMAFFAFFVTTRSERDLEAQAIAAVAGLAALSAWALGDRFLSGAWNQAGGYGGTAAFAGDLAAVAPLVVLLWAGSELRFRRAAGWFLAALFAAAAFCSEQRIVWPVLAVQGALLLGWLYASGALSMSRKAAAGTAIALVVAAAATFALVQSLRFRGEASTVSTVAEDVRLPFWGGVLETIGEHPLAGAGFGREAMKRGYPELIPKDYHLLWHAHNVVLDYGLGMGLPGVVALLLLFGALARRYALLLRAPDRKARAAGIAGLLLVAGVLLRNQVNDMFLRDQSMLFWALNGMLLGFGLRREPRPT